MNTSRSRQVTLLALSSFVAAVSAGCSAPSAADAVGEIELAVARPVTIHPPRKPAAYHEECTHSRLAGTPACAAAAHRLCNEAGYGAGVVVHGSGAIQGSCFQPLSYDDVPIAVLQAKHESCTLAETQSDACIAAAHRFCVDRHGPNSGGVIQEVGTASAAVACFAAEPYIVVAASEVRRFSQEPHASSASALLRDRFAASGYCGRYYGVTTGIVQEIGPSDLGVACMPAPARWYSQF